MTNPAYEATNSDVEKLINCEIADFFAGIGQPGEPETPQEMQQQLQSRISAIFNASPNGMMQLSNELAEMKRKCAAYESGEYGFFAYWPQHGEELFKKREDAVEFCNEAIEDYRRENAEEGCDENEVRRVCWGVVMQAGIDVAIDDEGHIDYALTAVLGTIEWSE